MKFRLKHYFWLTDFLLLLTITISPLYIGQNSNISEYNMLNTNNVLNIEPHSQGITIDNSFEGIGAPWNITHWANRTDYDNEVGFSGDGFDIVSMPLGSGWNAYKIAAEIKDLIDKRNWNNGTFSFGDDDGDYSPLQDDSADIENSFQNWTFFYDDSFDTWDNDMSGNYIDSTSNNPDSEDHDCLELRMDGDNWYGGDDYVYEENNYCGWNTTIQIPRGRVIDSELFFEVRDFHLMPSNDLELAFYINGEKVFSKGIYNLKQYCLDSWSNFSIPQGLWSNQSDVYSNPLNDSTVEVLASLEYIGTTTIYSDYDDGDYQQIFIDNVKLIVEAESMPSQINLKMNELSISDDGWGKGNVEQNNIWITSSAKANFSSEESSEITIDMLTDLNVFAIKNEPETNFETNTESVGTVFEASNETTVNWLSYGYISVPSGYIETELKIQFPDDITMTEVYDPQNPTVDILTSCDNSTNGILVIPVEDISGLPDGYWRFKATSPNYCQDLSILKNSTVIPIDSDWLEATSFRSGEFINISGRITDSSVISGYIEKTKAELNIRFPNGSLWSSQFQTKECNIDGTINFDYFKIPNNLPNYEVGEYEAIITWNNSYNSNGLNETGIIYKKFTVTHDSKLTPEMYYYDQIFENEILNLRIDFNDLVNDKAIEDADVYLYDFEALKQDFIDIGGGYYFLALNVTGGISGNNQLTIFANSTYYTNNQINVTINVITETILNALEYPSIDVYWNNNFSIHINYTEKNSGLGISTTPIHNWIGEFQIVSSGLGLYNLTFNSSAYDVNMIHLLIIETGTPGYENGSIFINIKVLPQPVTLFSNVNDQEITENSIFEISFNEEFSLSIRAFAGNEEKYLKSATFTIFSNEFTSNLIEFEDCWQNLSIFCSPNNFSLGLNYVSIKFEKENYTTSFFNFQLLVDQIELGVEPINFVNSIEAKVGESITFRIRLVENGTANMIEDASVKLTWIYGVAEFVEVEPGIYEVILDIPSNIDGSQDLTLTITKEGILYKTTQKSYILIVNPPEPSNLLTLIIIGVLVSVVSILGILSLRSYVLQPRKRRKEAELLARTQPFKDIENVQAVIIISSGIPIFLKSYSILEKQKKEIFSGFIEAILTISEEFSGQNKIPNGKNGKNNGIKKILEFDFKYFQCLICDKKDIRIAFILKEKASDRLKAEIARFSHMVYGEYASQPDAWNGDLDFYEDLFTPILNGEFKLHYKESFELAGDDASFLRIKKSGSLNKLEVRILNIIRTIQKNKQGFNFQSIMDVISEKNVNLIIDGIESLINKKIIKPIAVEG